MVLYTRSIIKKGISAGCIGDREQSIAILLLLDRDPK